MLIRPIVGDVKRVLRQFRLPSKETLKVHFEPNGKTDIPAQNGRAKNIARFFNIIKKYLVIIRVLLLLCWRCSFHGPLQHERTSFGASGT